MTTKRLLNLYVRLLDDFASNGPSPRLLVARNAANLSMRLYRLRQEYEAMKRLRPDVYIKFLESDRPITQRDREYLDAAAQVNRQITGVLRAWRDGMQATLRERTTAREGN